MPKNLIMSVKREIGRLMKEIGRRTSELAAVKDDLKKPKGPIDSWQAGTPRHSDR